MLQRRSNPSATSFPNNGKKFCQTVYTLSESRVVIADWRQKFNRIRPHRSLGMQTPHEFASAQSKPSRPKVGKAA